MRIFFPFSFKVNIKNFLQKAGYSIQFQRLTGRMSFIKRLTSDSYPHFHVYVEKDIQGHSYLSLHLDQKKPSYPLSHPHSGEYSGKVVEKEMRRLQSLIFNTSQERK